MLLTKHLCFTHIFYQLLFIAQFSSSKKAFASIANEMTYAKFPTKLFEECPEELLRIQSYHKFPEMCHNQTPLAIVAYDGILDAMSQCREQMRFKSWDCSQPAATMLHEPTILKYGYRESAYLWALSAAGAAWGVATACAQGWLEECKCVNHSSKIKNKGLYSYAVPNRRQNIRRRSSTNKRQSDSLAVDWEWSGCSYGVQYGVATSRKLLTRTTKKSQLKNFGSNHNAELNYNLLRKLEKHNLKIGRMAVKKTLISSCKCHGVSGSCQQRTCWKKTANLKTIAVHLTEKYEQARQIKNNNVFDAKSSELVFVQEMSDLCAQYKYDVQEIEKPQFLRKRSLPRVCNWRNETHSQGDCSSLCCGLGYTVSHEVISYKCDCKFVWCCKVECSECLQHRWVSTCNV